MARRSFGETQLWGETQLGLDSKPRASVGLTEPGGHTCGPPPTCSVIWGLGFVNMAFVTRFRPALFSKGFSLSTCMCL